MLYDYVRRADHPVSRDEAADAHHMSRNLAAFHLDKLVAAGLLHARYETPPDQPRGRGRAPKVYQAATDGVALSIPERRYELIGEILTDAIAEAPNDAHSAALRQAKQRGRVLGTQVRGTHLSDVLASLGFEPDNVDGEPLVLRNCPFHVLATRQTTLVCGLNQAFLTGLLQGLHLPSVHARLAPRADACCVQLSPTPPTR
jgi:predicted ArsR family transcriptional regulator